MYGKELPESLDTVALLQQHETRFSTAEKVTALAVTTFFTLNSISAKNSITAFSPTQLAEGSADELMATLFAGGIAVSLVSAKETFKKIRIDNKIDEVEKVIAETKPKTGTTEVLFVHDPEMPRTKRKSIHVYWQAPKEEAAKAIALENVAPALIRTAERVGATKIVTNSSVTDVHAEILPLKHVSFSTYVRDYMRLPYEAKDATREPLSIIEPDQLKYVLVRAEAPRTQRLAEELLALAPKHAINKASPYLSDAAQYMAQAANILKPMLERSIQETLVQRSPDGNKTRLPTTAKIRPDGTSVDLYANGRLVDTTNDLAMLLGIDEQTIADVADGSGEQADAYALNKRIKALEVALYRAVSTKAYDQIYAQGDAEGFSSVNSPRRLQQQIPSSKVFLGYNSELRRTHPKGYRLKRFAGLAALAMICHAPNYAAQIIENDSRERLADEYSVDKDMISQSDVQTKSAENGYYSVYLDALDLKDRFLETRNTNTELSDNEEAARAINEAETSVLRMSAGVGNVGSNGGNPTLYDLQVTGDIDPNGYWELAVQDTLVLDGANMYWDDTNAAIYTGEGSTGSIYTNTVLSPSPPKGVTNYITVTSSDDVQSFPIRADTTSLLSPQNFKYHAVKVPVLKGMTIVAARLDDQDVRFTNMVTTDGIEVLVADTPIENRGRITYFLAPETSYGSYLQLAHANGELQVYPNRTDATNTGNTLYTGKSEPQFTGIEDLKAQVRAVWYEHAPEILQQYKEQNLDERELNYLIFEHIKNSKYDLRPLPKDLLENGTILDIIAETISGEDRDALCNTANTTLVLSSSFDIQPITGFYNSDGSAAKDGSGSLSLSASESHMWAVGTNGMPFDATPSRGADQFGGFFREGPAPMKEKSPMDTYIPLSVLGMVALAGLRPAGKLLSRKARIAGQQKALELHESSGELREVYQKLVHDLYSDGSKPFKYNRYSKESPDQMRAFLKEYAAARGIRGRFSDNVRAYKMGRMYGKLDQSRAKP